MMIVIMVYRAGELILTEEIRCQLKDVGPHLTLAQLTLARFKKLRSTNNLERAIA
jgi:hypothetical protein